MEYTESQLISEAANALRRYLADVPFCTIESTTLPATLCDDEVDWVGKLRLPDGERLLILEVEASGQPRIARLAAYQLLRYVEKSPGAVPVFAATYISPDAADILTREGINYIDLAGNCRLVFDQVYICRADWPNKLVKRRDLRSLYSPKAERVLRVLLLEPKRIWKIKMLAEAAGVSLGQASNVNRLLEDREWISRESDGIVLRQPARLLREWAQNYRFERNTVRDYYSSETLNQIEVELARVCRDGGTEYGLTGFSVAVRVAPMVRYQRATAYVNGSTDDIARRLGLKSVSSGANVSLIQPYDEGVLAGSREINGVRVVSPIQTYLDLQNFKGRGEEAAQAVLEQAIESQW